ncbi:Serine/threonine protein kinase (fragment) [Candidatus Sulfopaludibacter sp. SbA4]
MSGTLAPGTLLGPYRIVEPIGAGGMGEVYKASDTRLERVVAVKLLTRNWAGDTEMRQRFEREARIVASLNHPNICVLHDVGQQDGLDFLVMEYLEGEDLAARLERGPLEIAEALKIAVAIADALDKAHRSGVVHRDLKPSNIILTAGGPKLLDFGLAKREGALAARENTKPSTPRPSIPSRTQMPTVSNLTTLGAVMGTLQYMAPEQLEGLEADGRADIFAFGALVYEMVTGKKAFVGKSRILLMSAIATSEPEPMSAVIPATPPALEHVVKTCLAKDPEDRWQTARDLQAELEWIEAASPDAGVSAGRAGSAVHAGKREKLARILLAAGALLLAAAALPAARYLGGREAAAEFRFQIPLSGTAQPYDVTGARPTATRNMAGANFALSPDGRLLAFVSRAGSLEPWALYVRPIGSVTPQKLLPIEDAAPHASQPFWSADSRFVGFVARGKLRKIEASGGPPQDICDAAGFTGGTWNREGTILFGSASGLLRVSAEGGKPETVTTLEQGESGHYWPHFLPDGHRYLYTSWNSELPNAP